MFFTKYISLLALPIFAVAMPGAAPQIASQCNTGPIQCCNSVQSASSPDATTLLGLLGIVVSDLDALIGVTCSPVTVIGGGTSGCAAQPVCCENNNFNGLVVIGCTPINI